MLRNLGYVMLYCLLAACIVGIILLAGIAFGCERVLRSRHYRRIGWQTIK
jgi:hypothetical protein